MRIGEAGGDGRHGSEAGPDCFSLDRNGTNGTIMGTIMG